MKEAKDMNNSESSQDLGNSTSTENSAATGNSNSTSNSKSTSDQKSNKTKKIIIGVACVVVVAGTLTGVILNKDKIFKDNSNSNNTTISENKTDKTEEIKLDEDESDSIKLEASKPFVYDADYLEGRDEKTYKDSYGIEYKSTYSLRYPFINIDSDYVTGINILLRKDFEKAYAQFGNNSDNSGTSKVSMVNYQYAVSDNILSVVVQKRGGSTNDGLSTDYMIYNINLNTLGKASVQDVYTECGFTDETHFKEQVDIALNNEHVGGNIPESSSWDMATGLFYMDQSKCFNIIVQGSATLTNVVVTPDMIKVENPSNNGNENNTDNADSTKSYFEQNKDLSYTSNFKDDINGKVALIKMGEDVFKTTQADGYYIYDDGFDMSQNYNIKQITSISSKFVATTVADDLAEFSCTIRYIDNNNSIHSFDVAVLLSYDFANSELVGDFNAFSASTRSNKLFGYYSYSYTAETTSRVSDLFDVKNRYEVMYSPRDSRIEGIRIYTDCPDCTGISSAQTILDDITITSEDVSAGTKYVNFDFTANSGVASEDITGNGTISISSDGSAYIFRLNLNFDKPVFTTTFNGSNYDVSAATEDYIDLANY